MIKIFNEKINFKTIFYLLDSLLFSKKRLKESTNLYDYAIDQLQRAGLLNSESVYDGLLGQAVLELIETFANQGHSGFSANIAIALFKRLANYNPINEIKNPIDTKKYEDMSEYDNSPPGTFLQSTELFNLFSRDSGKNWYLLIPEYHKDDEGIDYCTYYEEYVSFPFQYEDYYND